MNDDLKNDLLENIKYLRNENIIARIHLDNLLNRKDEELLEMGKFTFNAKMKITDIVSILQIDASLKIYIDDFIGNLLKIMGYNEKVCKNLVTE